MERSTEPCPKCGQTYVIGQNSCSTCGLVFAKWEQKQQGNFVAGNQTMELAWQDVLNQWDQEPIHAKFIDNCYRGHNLPFASQKYKQILSADPNNETAQEMQKQIQCMVMSTFVSSNPPKAEKVYSNKILYVFLFLSAVMVLLGLGMPTNFLSTGMPLVAVGVFAFVVLQFFKRYFAP